MNNIFKGVKFGDKFLTRDGHIAILCNRSIEFDKSIMYYFMILISYDDGNWDIQDCWVSEDNGMCGDDEWKYDIVSRYQEPIDENKLSELAMKESYNVRLHDYVNDYCPEYCYELGFISGYKKAKTE